MNPPTTTPRQVIFANIYVKTSNAALAYKLAGYKPNRHHASELLRRRNVAALIRRERAKTVKKIEEQVTTRLFSDLRKSILTGDRQASRRAMTWLKRLGLIGRNTTRNASVGSVST